MKKKIISGLTMVLFTGLFGFVTVTEAIGNFDSNRDHTVDMRHRADKNWDLKNDKVNVLKNRIKSGGLSKEDASDIQNEGQESTDYLHRRESRERSHMYEDNTRCSSRMNNSYR